MMLAAWLLALPFRLAFALGLRRTVALACLLVLAVSVGNIASELGLLEPAQAAPGHRKPPRAAPSRQPPSSSYAGRLGIPAAYLALYRRHGAGESWGGIPAWAVLAGVGKVESDHGRSSAPGVRSGVNAFGCCAGPMQFNLRNGPPSTWDRYGRGSPYDPADAIAAAARYLRASGARQDLGGALHAYNRSWSYVREVQGIARRYATGRPA